MSDDMVERDPVEVFSLGSFLGEEMAERGWTSGDVAIRMGGLTSAAICRDQLIVELLLSVQKDSVKIGDDLFHQLGVAFGVSDGLFKELHSEWSAWPNRRVEYEAPDELYGPAQRTVSLVGLNLVQ